MKRNIPAIHDFAAQKKISARRLMDFTTNANPVGPSSRALNAVRKNVKLLGIPVDNRARYLARAIARTHSVPEDAIVTSGGFDGLFSAITRSFDIRTLLLCTPYPSYYRDIVEGPYDIDFLTLKANDRFVFDRKAFETRLAGCDGGVLPHPSFMSVAHLALDDLLGIIAFAEDQGKFLIIDETLIYYSVAGSAAGAVAGHPHCVVVSSLAEYYALQGLPVSYCIGDPAMVAAARRRFPVDAPPSAAAAAAAESLRDKTYRDRTGAYLANEHAFIGHGLRKIPGISFYITVCGSFIIQFTHPRSQGFEIFSRYGILVDPVSDNSLFFPVKDHKWNARFLKTLKNLMGGH